jgi:hypothetical protein
MEHGKMFGRHPWSPHLDRKCIYNGVHPGSPRGSFTTMLLMPEQLAAFCPKLATLAWVDQSPVSQGVLVTLYMVSPTHLLPSPM